MPTPDATKDTDEEHLLYFIYYVIYIIYLSLLSDCRNKDEAQCNRLGKGVCTSGRYKVWAAENCAKLCGVGDCQSEEKGK